MSDYEDEDESGDYDEESGDYEDDEDRDEDDNDHRGKKEDDYFEDTEPEMVAERAAFERTEMRKGFSRKQSGGDYDGKEAWKGRSDQTDEENFADDLDIFYIPNRDRMSFSQRDFETINSLIDIIPHIKCKNPSAFLLAYYALDTNTQKINRDRLLSDKKYRSLMNEKDITTEDIIRYCRLILKYI